MRPIITMANLNFSKLLLLDVKHRLDSSHDSLKGSPCRIFSRKGIPNVPKTSLWKCATGISISLSLSRSTWSRGISSILKVRLAAGDRHSNSSSSW
uniref:Uncharacterized protein n=1 Tax=Anguilla anguilla TaxID=7936 RepID=A0A0E9VLW7_ANGAN